MNIAIIGTGAYGLSIALALLNNNYKVKMWVESEERAKYIDENRNTVNIIPNIKIPKDIEFSNDYEYILKDTNIVFIAVSAKFIPSVSKDLVKYNIKNKHVCILSKGIEENTCDFVSEVFKKYTNSKKISVISGPSFAIDLANMDPIALSIASKNKDTIEAIKKVLSSNYIKLRDTKDVLGTEICGSVKNIIAIGSGMLEGLGYKESSRSFLITESIHDIKELIDALGGDKKTVLSYAGIGDLILTATSTKSRNYSYGILIGKKEKEKSVNFLNSNTVEGYFTLKSIYKLIKRKKINIPIIDVMYDIIFKEKDPDSLVKLLIKKA